MCLSSSLYLEHTKSKCPPTKKTKKLNTGKFQPCFGRSGNLCGKQIKTTTSFKSDNTGKVYDIYHNVNCKLSNLIYLMECTLCEKKQYVGKCEWSFNRRINSHRNDVWRVDGPPCDKHFQLPNHYFNKHAKFTIIEDYYTTKRRQMDGTTTNNYS